MVKQNQNQKHISAHEHPFYEGMSDDALTFVAHRGGDGGYENTHAAFEAAENAGIEIIETDIVNTSDGVAVHFHGDSHTRKIINATTLLDLNRRRTHDKIGFKGDLIPTLDETLDVFPNLRFFLDLKSRQSPIPVARSIKRAGAQDRVSIDGEHYKNAMAVLEEIPEGVSTTIGPMGLLALYVGAKNLPGYDFLKNRYLTRSTSFSLPKNRVGKSLLDVAHDLEMPAFLYVVDTESDIDRAAEIGASGVMADRLALLGHKAISSFNQPALT